MYPVAQCVSTLINIVGCGLHNRASTHRTHFELLND